jgi:hypothetical protein
VVLETVTSSLLAAIRWRRQLFVPEGRTAASIEVSVLQTATIVPSSPIATEVACENGLALTDSGIPTSSNHVPDPACASDEGMNKTAPMITATPHST